MRRFVIPLVLGAAVVLSSAAAVAAKGPQPGNLSDHGWTCFPVPELGVHCTPPGKTWAPPVQQATPLLYWFTTFDTTDTDADFTGTELLMPQWQWDHGQPPCPQEDLLGWANIGIARACHHN